MDNFLVVVFLFVAMPGGTWGRPQLVAPTGPSAVGIDPHGGLQFIAAATAPDQPDPAPLAVSAPAPVPAPVPLPVPAPFVTPAKTVSIVQQHFEQAPDGQYRWSYATSDGATQDAIGVVGNSVSPNLAVEGSYGYHSADGQYQVHYIADEFGFQPTGAHIHPAILEAVRRQVEFARSEPADYYNEAGFPVNQNDAQSVSVAAPEGPPSAPHAALL